MSSMELNDLTEGDMLYLQYLSNNKEEIITISSDESAFYDDTNCSDNDTSDNTQNGHTIRKIKDIKNEIELIDNKMLTPETISKDAGNSKLKTLTSETISKNADCTPKDVIPSATDIVQNASESRVSPFRIEKIFKSSLEKTSSLNSDIARQSLQENTTGLRQEISQAIIKEKRCSTASETANENATDSQEESSQTSVKKKRFSSKNLIKLFCTQCDKTIRRVWGEKRTKCNGCRCLLHHQCAKCYRCFRTYQSAFLHVKHECRLLPKHVSFNCTRCYFEAKSKEKLEEHEVDRHTVLNCQDCGVSCESNQMVKHRLYECEARMVEDSFSADNTSETDINKTNKTSVSASPLRKQKKYNSHCFLEMYCKRCDITATKVKNKRMQKCDNCKRTLLHQCFTCCRRYKLVISAYAHVRVCNNPDLFHCTQCDYKTSHKACLASHVQIKHQAQKCEVCGAVCENKQALKVHQKQCLPNSLYKDDFSRSANKSNVSSKSRKRKPTRNVLKFFCATCNTVKERYTEQSANCKTCSTPFQFYCTRCRSTFVSFSRGYAHIRRVCSRYRCKQCEFRSARRKQLQEHVALEHQQPQPQLQPEPQQLGKNVKVQCQGCGRMIRGHLLAGHLEECDATLRCENCDFKASKMEVRKNAKLLREEDGYDCPKCGKKLLNERNIGKQLNKDCTGGSELLA